MRKFVARIEGSFIAAYCFPAASDGPASDTAYFQQYLASKHPMPVVKWRGGVPQAGDICVVTIEEDTRWYYHRQHAKNRLPGELENIEEVRNSGAYGVPLAPRPDITEGPETPFGKRILIRVFRLPVQNGRTAAFSLLAFRSAGKSTSHKHVSHENPPADQEELAGGISTSATGVHWERIAILLKKEAQKD